MSDVTVSDLPRPFYNQWSRRRRRAAHALWAWHSALADRTHGTTEDGSEPVDSFFDDEQRRAEAGDPLRIIGEEVSQSAYAVCEEYELDRSLLAAQVDAARKLQGETQFETEGALKRFVGRWAAPHGRLLAGLAGLELSIHLQYVDELARGFFHLGRLISLPEDVANARLFIPLETLRQKEVTVDQLETGDVDESVRRLLWKESVRIRDALAQGRPLIANLSLRHGYALKRFWIGALELLDELDRRDYDLWTQPLSLPWFRRVQVWIQTILGRSMSR